MKIVAERIKCLRKLHNMTQIKLSIELGISQETISRYEKGKILPPIDMLDKIASCLHTSTDYLLGRTDTIIQTQFNITEMEYKLLKQYRNLSNNNKERVLGYIEALKT